MRISEQGADFIKSFEGCGLEAYHYEIRQFV